MTLKLASSSRRAPSRKLIAADVMTTNPKSIDQNATVGDTAEFLSTNEIHTAPVIDEAGRPVGVVSRSDLFDYLGTRRDHLVAVARGKSTFDSLDARSDDLVTNVKVMQIMTPVVFCLPIDAPVATVIQKMLALEVRCLFVTDEHGVLVGVISIFNLLRSVAEPAGHTQCGRSRHLTTASSSFAGEPRVYSQTELECAPP